MAARRWALVAAALAAAVTPTTAVAQEATTVAPAPTEAVAPATTEAATTTNGPACTSVAHLGDSTTVMMRDALRVAYAEVGWASSVIDAGGGRGVFHAVPPDVNALRAVARVKAAGFSGCWVVAMGINDVLDIDAGDQHTVEQTVRALLDAIGPSPVLWATVHLPRHAGTAARLNAAIAADGRALVFDWDAVVAAQPDLQLPDLVHFTTAGSRTFASHLAAASLALRGMTVPPPPSLPPAVVAMAPLAAPSLLASRALARPSFRYGSHHRDVTRLQAALRRAGLDVGSAERGRFGPRTYLAVLAYSRRQGLPARGVVTATTATALGLG